MPTAGGAKPRRRFVRRSPDEARQTILDAAERVFTRFVPDEVGLREIAEEAEISHGLITHYFGTYAGLIEATLARRLTGARTAMLERLVGATFTPDEVPLVEALAELIHEPLTLRLLGWAMMSGRSRRHEFLGDRGLRLVADGITARLAALGLPAPPRERIEFAVAASVALALGFAIAGDAMDASLGREPPFDRSAAFREIKVMIRRYVDRRDA